jgi:DNA-binding NarL/FixJ family response regulator
MDGTISLWLASGSSQFRQSLNSCLERNPQFLLVGQSNADVEPLATQLNARRTDILLVDWPAPARRARDVQTPRQLAALAPRVLVLVAAPTMGIVAGVLRNRLHGYLQFDSTPEECGRAISRVRDGEVWIPRSRLAASLAELLLERDARQAADISRSKASAGLFTTREREIVLLVRKGMTNKQIGHELGIVEDTVKKHLQHIYDKIGVRRRSVLVMGSGPGRA